ncbi:effector-binding domain-containing protein [Flavobacterium fluvii]|uniref:Effector-binding domain-containing protein n=1 Tax=Flavobacterium fluvii TaxID=468056 RepID=A0A1M5M3D8_9FLAO|nr:GyrI-like domain-containing protein [Flavobacterium fluvii]SHG71768.1 effector-binding domain-containing protein [Flavobacterium fluvii]
MRILKYLFLLLLLSLVALSIFVATQKGEFTVERSKIINSPKSAVFNYVNDANNWKEWNSLAVEDSLIKITPSQNTIGKGSSFFWQGEQGEGDFQTINTKENESIIQKVNYNGNSADVSITFKDTLGKTKVSWKAKGQMGFLFKVMTAFNGGANKIFGSMFEKSLFNLDKKLDYEINTFSIKVDGLVDKPETYYLAQTFTSEFSKVGKNSGIVFSKITDFCKKNNITINGKPFVIYHTYDTKNELTKLSICIPIKDPIFITEGSDISSKTLPLFQALKTTLTGHYSHNKKALDKATEYLHSKYLGTDAAFSHLEIYTIGKNETNNPSKWITEIYYPIRQKVVVKPAAAIPASTSEKVVPKAQIEKEIPSEF